MSLDIQGEKRDVESRSFLSETNQFLIVRFGVV